MDNPESRFPTERERGIRAILLGLGLGALLAALARLAGGRRAGR